MIKELDNQKVVVGISGGVDSAVCLKILKSKGLKVYPVYLKMCRFSGTIESSLSSAKKVARASDAKLDVIDVGKEFKDRIINYYNEEIKKGNTPSPCVLCNPEVKIKTLISYADRIGAKYIATGHYARVIKSGSSYSLKVAKDKRKDQTYSLCFLSQSQISRLMLPLGNLTKNQVYKIASRIKDLEYLQEIKQSQDFCYLGNTDPIEYSKVAFPKRKGKIIDIKGTILGSHDGIYQFTIGQRKGIGLPGGPYYIISKNVKTNDVVVSNRLEDLLESKVILYPYHFIGKKLKDGETVDVKLRSSQKTHKAKINYKNKNIIVLNFKMPQKAVTPGQIAVMYNRDICLGGGVISKS